MKVSVIIPAHNEANYIEKTLQAVLALEYRDFEIIVVDNNSTDATAEIVRRFPQVKLISELQKGTQFTRERGRKEARGELIASLDADCLPPKEWLKHGAQFFNDKSVVAVGGPYYYHDGSFLFKNISFLFQKISYPLANNILQFFSLGGVLIAGNCFIRASTLEKISGYDTSFTFYGDDTDTAKRLSKYGRIIFTTSLTIDSSSRRFKNQGIIYTFSLYIYNFFKIILHI